MKIIKCHIENFGKFSDFTIDFDDEKNVICEENGWGKSTLAAFIKVMLYGFDNDTKKDEFENERKRFRPWQGGVYGGQLIFEAGGKIYEASRVFGAKDKDDIFVLKDDNTGLESSDFSKKLGEELFGLDSKSFSRSIFVSQNACDTSVTDGISAKLGNLTDSTDDIINYEKASTRLTDILNSMSPRRSTGDIYRQKDKMTELKQIISQGTDLESSLDNLVALNKAEKTAIEELKEEQQIWSKRQQETSRYKDLEIKKNDFERINKALEEKKDSYEKEKAIFKTSIPDKSELNSKLELAYSLSEKKRALSIYELNEDEISKLSDIDTVLKDESLKIEEEKNIVKSLEKEISDDEINLKNNMDKIKTVESDLSSETYKDYGKLIIKDIIYLIIGIGCLVLVLNLKKVIPALVALMAIAMLVIIVGLFVNIYNYFSLKKNKSINDLDNSISGVSGHANQSRLITYVPKKQEIISTDENDTDKEKAFNNEKESVDEKDNFLKEKEDYINNKKEKLNDKKIRIKELEKLHEQNIYIKNNLTDKKNNYIKVSDEYKSAYNDVKNYLADLGFEPEDDMYKQLDFLEEKIRDIEELKAEVDKISKEKELFNINNDIDAILSAKEIETNYSLTEIDEYLRKIGSEIESHNKNIAGYNRQIDELEERLEYINECENELDELNESYEKKMHKFKMLKETGTLLEEAKAAFTAKYTAPIKNGFDKYYSMITGKSDNTYRLDANIKLSHKELGLDRDTKFLSMGYKDLVGVCMRMALVDAMYEKEKPFIIFDDSFVNLDKDKVEAGLGLLDKIAKEYQIIYFTCHESRV
ncbi:MAG: AAA family ATPase [Lachnospiraceae bacterium]|nr:AAA family ATPase [Lachnospiraceae bacterium]